MEKVSFEKQINKKISSENTENSCKNIRKSKESGVTLVETIIAMALVMIISVSVYFTCNYTLKIQNENTVKAFFANETENLAVCYYHSNSKSNTPAENYEKLRTAFEFSSGLSNVENGYFDFDYVSGAQVKSITIYYAKDFSYLEKEKKDECAYIIVFSFTQNENGNYYISTYSNASGKLISEREV